MLSFLFGILHVAALAGIALAMVAPSWRLPVRRGLLALGLAALAGGVLSGERTLGVTAAFPGYQGREVRLTDFPIETVTAPGIAFGAVALLFAALWWFVLGRLDRTGDVRPFVHPLLLGWSGIALNLAFEKLAAPAALVSPVPFERAILPAAVAAAVLFAWKHRSLMSSLLWLCLFVSVVRLPLAALGTWFTQESLGTSLDVHSITRFANPFAAEPMQVVAHSSQQLAWLVWIPHLLVLPSLYLFSTGGIAFAATMFALHPKGPAPVPGGDPGR